jgi:hypothetical protein
MEDTMPNLLDELWPSSDLVVIVGDQDRTIGNDESALKERFHVEDSTIVGAVLTLMVRGLPSTTQQPVVTINDRRVGALSPTATCDTAYWFSDALPVGPGVLKHGENEIEIIASSQRAHGEMAAAFQIRELLCHYQTTRSG